MLSKIEIRQQFGQQSNWKGGLVVTRDLIFLGMALGIAYYWGQHWWLTILLIWFIGMIQFAMGESLLHEASHGNLFKTKKMNVWVGNLIAYAILTTLDEWRTEHQTHHGYLLSEQDHLTQDYIDYRLYKGIHPFITWILQPLLGWVGFHWLRSELGGLFKHKGVLLFYAILLVFCGLTNSFSFLFWYWIIPLIWAYSSILYWSEITDHYLAKAATRSNTSFFWNFMFHNGGYHWVHHEYPYIPWYLLKEADELLSPTDSPMDRTKGWWEMYQIMLEDYNSKHLV
ncbi:fatty acid desaturase family protein [Aureispira anguillae]|uniref:Fatty acid desaturase n=1 Tax=Aureispira anguillae TaxID=2864201 RepID=A0A916DSB4_9BACT|nr:fatty acid desaturase [Aureispira anguillae]BDS11766.1 fatty acid desaturase [Aureispira anguillae]